MRKTEPKDGDTRTINKFLWMPLTIDGETRWFERVVYVEHFRHENIFDLFGHTPMGWFPWYFVDKEEEEIA